MLKDQSPSDALIDWAEKLSIVKKAKDRPWWYSKPPGFAIESFKPLCTCKKQVEMRQYPCEDDSYVYIGQCHRCENILWTALECVGQ